MFVRFIAFALAIAALVGAAGAADLSALARFDASSKTVVDHGAWGSFLKKYASAGEPNLVAYGKTTADDRAALKAYIGALQKVKPTSLNRDEAFAYWVNLYNAVTVDVVIDAYPVKSIRDIKSGGVYSLGPWGRKIATVEGVTLSLNEIEHELLRAHFGDNRVHYAVNCASIGCPDLRLEPWTGEGLDAALDAAARAYVNSRRGVAVENGAVVASSIYKWFRKDFGANDAEVLAHFLKYADADLAAGLVGKTRIAKHRYDWTLNEKK